MDLPWNQPVFFLNRKYISAVVKITLKKPPEVSSEERFFKMTRTAFQQRRKMLRASLKKLYSAEQIESSIKELGEKGTVRPEDLSLHDFLRFFEIIEKKD
jgi:16S rRNA (adenine1518-N6/adenine1519-N6)-dimethyltransferase